MREPATILCDIYRQVRQPMDSQYYDATKREQTRSIVARIFNTFIVFRVGLPAHNGLVAGSSPAGPTILHPKPYFRFPSVVAQA